jgi:hypothetical protein
VGKGHQVDAPKANKFLLREFRESIHEGMKYWIAWGLDAMGHNDLSLAQEKIGQKINEYSEERALPRALSPGDEINTVV